MLSAHHSLKRISTFRCLSTRNKAVTRHPPDFCGEVRWLWSSPQRRPRSSRYPRKLSKCVPANQRLAASILKSSPKLIMASANSTEMNAELTEAIYDRLGLDQPKQLQSEYTDSKPHHDALASLVAEETRYTIVSELEKRFSLKNRKTSQARGVLMKVTDGERNFFEAWTCEPLSSFNRNKFKAGTVVMMVQKGRNYDPKHMILGTIQFGSKATQLCKCLASKQTLGKTKRLTLFLQLVCSISTKRNARRRGQAERR